jgi:hypothetical protein
MDCTVRIVEGRMEVPKRNTAGHQVARKKLEECLSLSLGPLVKCLNHHSLKRSLNALQIRIDGKQQLEIAI